ncbi:MAG: GspE/PulE family protein [Minisyncoccia bacterium]
MDDLTQKREEKIKALWQEAKERETQRLAQKYNFLYIDLKKTPIETGALSLVDETLAKEAQVAVFQKIGNLLKIAIVDPLSEKTINIIEDLRKKNYNVSVYLVTPESLNYAQKFYSAVKKKPEEFARYLNVSGTKEIEFTELHQELLPISYQEVTLLVSLIFKSAILVDASDVHIEPQETDALIRFRIDGILYDVSEIDKEKYQKIKQRLKILSGVKLNIENTPQNGRFTIINGRDIFEVRASTLPGPYGEFLVFRLLNPKRAAFGLKDLGLSPKGLTVFKQFISSPNGMILVTGPTGSGKTTTLYAMLKEKVSPGIKIITIEDPIEYRLIGINQTQVDKKYDFATGLKSILRQDPDVIMVGEMRDKETVEIALQASLTGHLVFSTLHTNEASGTISRLIELGAERRILPDALKLIIAQRLVRRLCPHCREKHELTEEEKKKFLEFFSILSPKSEVRIPKDIPYFYKAKGCSKCHYLGYKEQIGIFEYFPVSPRIIKAIQEGLDQNEIRKIAIDEGMVPLFHDGLLKVIEGVTSLEEVIRVAGDIEYIQEMYKDLFSQILTRGIILNQSEEQEIEQILKERKPLERLLLNKDEERKLAIILGTAYKSRATDVHFEPQEDKGIIRERIDGVLHPLTAVDLNDFPKMIATIKSISGLKTEEFQKVQEGRTRLILPNKKSIDIRVSIIPGGYGETASLRLLKEQISILALENLGLLKETKELVERIIKERKTGLILATGPTSSGKTTTLFAFLKILTQPGVKVITVEDPIEYRLENVIQTQVNEEKGYTFAVALRSLLRQNPNIFLIGEIRDKETAQLVWQASLTGHLVLSTIHANDAPKVIERLKSLEIPVEEMLSAINLIIGQRLVRKLCPKCKREIKEIDEELLKMLNKAKKKYPFSFEDIPKPYKIYKPVGCSYCNYTGYYGLTGVFETLTSDQIDIKNLDKLDYPTLLDDAIIKLFLGITSFEEIKRVLSL